MNLVKSISIDNLLAQRDAIVQRLESMQAMAGEIDGLARTFSLANTACLLEGVSSRGYYSGPLTDEAKGMEMMVKRLDASAWKLLMDESGLRTFMDATARREWDDKIHDLKVIPLTRENITTTFEHLMAARGDIFERGVIAAFRRLSWDYKTNMPQMFGKRIILTSFLEHGHGTTCYPGYRISNELDDLVRCFCIMDGKPEPDHRQGMHWQLDKAMKARATALQHDYFSLRWFRGTKTGHLTFSRPDLVEKMNGIIAKHYPGALFQGRAA